MIKIVLKLVKKYKQYIKFVIAGGTATLAQFSILFIFTEVFHLWYVFSASFGYIAGFLTSFFLQKYWTFRDPSRERFFSQISIYFAVLIVGMSINAAGMYYLVESFGAHYILAQAFIAIFIAVGNFFVYRLVIFKKGKQGAVPDPEYASSKKRLLLATGIFPPDVGGPATYTQILCDELKSEFAITVLTYADKGGEEALDSGVKIIRISRRQNKLLRYLKFFHKAWNLIRETDLVYIQDLVSAGLPTALASFLRCQEYVIKIVGDHAWEQGRQRFGVNDNLEEFQHKKYGRRVEKIRRLERAVASEAKLIITPSNYLKKIIHEWGVKEENIKVIYNAVRRAKTPRAKEELRQELDIQGKTIVSVGRLVPWKGFAALVELLRELPDHELIIVGDGPDREKLKTKSEEFKVSARVRFTGMLAQDEVWRYIKAADYFVLNTAYEGLPHVTIEAMMLGTPVITTRAGGNTEVVENDVNGILVEFNNQKEIKEAITILDSDPGRRDRLVDRAMLSLDKFGQAKMIGKIRRILNEFTI